MTSPPAAHECQRSDAGAPRKPERFYGTFCRSFTLPEYTDASAIRAESKDVVLTVHVPKLKVEKRKALQIKVE